MATHGKVGAVYAPDSVSGTSVIDETFSGTGSEKTFSLANEYVKPYSETITVDGIEQNRGTDYTIDYVLGEFTITAASGTSNVSVDYNYFTLSEVGGFFDWTLNENADTQEATDFQSNGEREYVSGLKDWDGSATKYWKSTKQFHDFIGEDVVMAFYIDETNNVRYEGWGVLTGASVDTAVDALVEESIDIQGSHTLTYRDTI